MYKHNWRHPGFAFILLIAMSAVAHANGVSLPGLKPIDASRWDAVAVRKVLHTFAYGAQARDSQIRKWAGMPPAQAIKQILHFGRHNELLSPPHKADEPREYMVDGDLRSLSDFWSSNDPRNRMPEKRREYFAVDAWNGPRSTWLQAVKTRGLNPFRAKVGFFETNIHMAVNQAAGVTTWQLMRYYDTIMNALENGDSYEKVIAKAASSAAVARQYGHEHNWWYDNTCHCNEDFARELHQLFFGILGTTDPQHHETVTIKNTAKALTGMPIMAREAEESWAGAYVDFRTQGHHRGPLKILGEKITGRNAREKIHAIAKVAIQHPESQDNLPLIIISGIAEDQMTKEKRRKLRRAWKAMKKKDLLRFLRAYAISGLFHDEGRVKYHTSIERHLLAANLVGLNNPEHFRDISQSWRLEWQEASRPFEPAHNVFGAQTGEEAANSARVFRLNYNDMTQAGYRFNRTSTDYEGMAELPRDWAAVVPKSKGRYRVKKVARWLWQRLVADGLKNYGRLEQAHLHSLLATGEHFGARANPGNPGKLIKPGQLRPGTRLHKLSQRLGNRKLPLDSRNSSQREDANRRMGQAVNFILATPYAFAQEGR